MIESAIISVLKADPELVALLSTHNSEPAIFSEFAPEDAEFPYIVLNVSRSNDEFPGLHAFTIMVDYFDYDVSRKNSRIAAERIEFLLDRAILQHERYDSIRISFFAGSPIPEDDPRSVHYNVQFSARAGRKKWMSQL